MDESSGLTVRIRQTRPFALDASFEIAPKELVALVGPSGSGKSTILRAIAGLNRSAAGLIQWHGRRWLDTANRVFASPQERSVGLVFQHYALFPHMTALGNVMAALDQLPANEREPRARTLLHLVHLEGLERRRPALLSGGQQQRVAIARAIAREPAILLLDEPFSAIDRRTRRALQVEIADLRARIGSAILLVTHDLAEVETLADRVIVIDKGRVIAVGTPSDVMSGRAGAGVVDALDLDADTAPRQPRLLPRTRSGGG